LVKGVRFNNFTALSGGRTRSPEKRLASRIQTWIGAAAGLVGLVAYLYLLGGFVMWLRFTAAQLPADDAVGSLDDRRLLATGVEALAFELVLLATLLLVARIAWRVGRKLRSGLERREGRGSTRSPKADDRSPASLAALLLTLGTGVATATLLPQISLLAELAGPIIVGFIAGVIAAILEDSKKDARILTSWPVRWLPSLILAAFAIAVLSYATGMAVLILVGLAHFSNRLERLSSVRDPIHLIPSVLAVGVCLSLVVAAYIATPPVTLVRAVVKTESGRTLTGGYIGRSSEGMILAICRPTKSNPMVSDSERLRVVAPDQIHRAFVGGPGYAFDYGEKPSIADLVQYVVEADGPVKERFATTSIDVRHNRPVCGLRNTFRVARTRLDKRTGRAWERLRVYGKGLAFVEGDQIESAERSVPRRSYVWLAITPTDAVQSQLARVGHATVQIETRFDVQSGESREKTRRLILRKALPARRATRLSSTNAR
jgi:hypothetical protein